MPRGRKRKGAENASPIIAPGGGTSSDITSLSRNLGLPNDAVQAIMSCQGSGVRSSRRSAAASASATGASASSAAGGAVMSNVWGDFLNEEMPGGSGDTATATKSVGVGAGNDPQAATKTITKEESTSVVHSASASAAANAAAAAPTGPRDYILPIKPRMRLAKDKSANDEDEDEAEVSKALIPAPGILAQTGTLDASTIGRSKGAGPKSSHDLECPTLLFPNSVFSPKVKIAFIAAAPSSCHSIAIDVNGTPYGWGRNETGQLGLGTCSAVVPTPTVIDHRSASDERDVIVGAGVGKYHSVLIGSTGKAYASGNNKLGQCGINSSVEQVDKFRKCYVATVRGKKKSADEKEEEAVRIVQVSCGEQFSVILSSSGHMYTTGSSEFGQLGNGETGEHFISGNKLAFANSTKFERRARFVQSGMDASSMGRGLITDGVDSSGKTKMVTLANSADIVIGAIACGKNHAVAVEALSYPAKKGGTAPTPRVFTWGCGDYGCLGHTIQADEYTPRLVGTLRGPMFASNVPVAVIAGAHCSMVRTKQGHVYYFGKHRNVGEATMRPTVIDALANNGHVVSAVGAGGMTVFCSTANGVTVSWGVGLNGELGYGKGEPKSSSKPKFVSNLDTCLVTQVACGNGHTLFLIRDDDEEDKKALKKVPKLEKDDIQTFLEEAKSKTISGAVDDDVEQKKPRGKGRPKRG